MSGTNNTIVARMSQGSRESARRRFIRATCFCARCTRTGANKRLVKNSPALICADSICSLRTEWSRMENKAASGVARVSKHRLTDRDLRCAGTETVGRVIQ